MYPSPFITPLERPPASPLLPYLRLIVHFRGKRFIVALSIESSVKDCKAEILRVYRGISSASDDISISELYDSNRCVLFDDYQIGMVVMHDFSELFALTEEDVTKMSERKHFYSNNCHENCVTSLENFPCTLVHEGHSTSQESNATIAMNTDSTCTSARTLPWLPKNLKSSNSSLAERNNTRRKSRRKSKGKHAAIVQSETLPQCADRDSSDNSVSQDTSVKSQTLPEVGSVTISDVDNAASDGSVLHCTSKEPPGIGDRSSNVVISDARSLNKQAKSKTLPGIGNKSCNMAVSSGVLHELSGINDNGSDTAVSSEDDAGMFDSSVSQNSPAESNILPGIHHRGSNQAISSGDDDSHNLTINPRHGISDNSSMTDHSSDASSDAEISNTIGSDSNVSDHSKASPSDDHISSATVGSSDCTSDEESVSKEPPIENVHENVVATSSEVQREIVSSTDSDDFSSDDEEEEEENAIGQRKALPSLASLVDPTQNDDTYQKVASKIIAPSYQKFVTGRRPRKYLPRSISSPKKLKLLSKKKGNRIRLSLSKQEASVVANITPANISTLLNDEDLW